MARSQYQARACVATLVQTNEVLIPGYKAGDQLSIRGEYWYNGEPWVLTMTGEDYPSSLFDFSDDND